MVLELIISGAVGGGLTVLATWGEYYRRQQDRKQRARTALLTELRTMLDPIETWSAAILPGEGRRLAKPPILEADPVLTDAYDARASQLGLFDSETVERITIAYSVAKRLQRRLERVRATEATQGAEMFGLLADVVQLHLFINLAIRQLESETDEQTPLEWPAVGGEPIDSAAVRAQILETWELEEHSVLAFQLDYRVARPTGDGAGRFQRLTNEDDLLIHGDTESSAG